MFVCFELKMSKFRNLFIVFVLGVCVGVEGELFLLLLWSINCASIASVLINRCLTLVCGFELIH